MKIPLHTIDEYTEDIIDPYEETWFEDKKRVSEETGVDTSKIEFLYNLTIGETVIYVDGVFYDYASTYWDFFVG